ncbi:hypothetical protein CC2G_011522 [Coprinopsis cinerea AmutBmut pab1-1]|nr:hypothetical protein CC2G_011522 [Coprinopsis cinerea AmutBmut pab1-1]
MENNLSVFHVVHDPSGRRPMPCQSTFASSLQTHFPQFQRCNQDELGDRRSVENLARQSLKQGLSVCIDRTNFNASQRFHWIKIAREFPGTMIWVIVFDTPYEVCVARLHERKFRSLLRVCSWNRLPGQGYPSCPHTKKYNPLPSGMTTCPERMNHWSSNHAQVLLSPTGTNHPTITSIELGLSVLSRFAADFEPPESHEGYDRILYLKPEDHPSALYTRSELAGILERVRDSKPVVAAPPAAAMSSFGGAPPSRGEYGYGGYGGGGYRGYEGGKGQGQYHYRGGGRGQWHHHDHGGGRGERRMGIWTRGV